MFYEPDYKSCTMLIATVSREKFGFDTKPLDDLIYWGDIIDGAQYATAQSAVESGGARHAIGAGDRSRAGRWTARENCSGTGLSAARGNGQACR